MSRLTRGVLATLAALVVAAPVAAQAKPGPPNPTVLATTDSAYGGAYYLNASPTPGVVINFHAACQAGGMGTDVQVRVLAPIPPKAKITVWTQEVGGGWTSPLTVTATAADDSVRAEAVDRQYGLGRSFRWQFRVKVTGVTGTPTWQQTVPRGWTTNCN